MRNHARPISRMQTSQGKMRTGQQGIRQAPGTAGRQAAQGLSLQRDLNVSDRPVTGQGMMGMRTGASGPGRQVHDRSYYLGKFRNKVRELQVEIQRLRQDTDAQSRESSSQQQLAHKYDALIKEVRAHEGTLADYNLALDKLRTQTDPMDVWRLTEDLEEENKQNEHRVDQIFEQRQQAMNKIKDCENKIDQVRTEADQKMNEMAPNKLNCFHELQNTNKGILKKLDSMYDKHDAMERQLQETQRQMAADTLRDAYAAQTKKIKRLTKEHADLQEELASAKMDPEEVREKMLKKVKKDKAKLEKLDEQLRQIEEENSCNKKVLADLNTDLAERRGESGTGTDSQKYDLLFARDKEMTAFIEMYPNTTEKELSEQQKIKTTIVALLQHISENVDRSAPDAMPSKDRVHEMRDDLSFKERQLESSASTKQRLEQELEKRQGELTKINTLDEKISVELSSLREKIELMHSEMNHFSQVSELKHQASVTRSKLMNVKQSYVQRGNNIKKQVSLLSMKYDSLKRSLDNNDTEGAMEALTQKLGHYEQNIFHLREFIKTKEHETDYVIVKEDCTRILEDLNQKIVKATEERTMVMGMGAGTNGMY